MQLTRTFTYQAPAGQVLAMLRYPGFWDRVAQETGATSSTTQVTEVGDTIEVVTEQDQKVVGLPSFAKKFVGETTRAIIRETWRGDTADYVIDAPGSPISINGTATVTESGAVTTVTYDLDVRCGVPIVGKKLEALACELTGKGLETEHAVGVDWLAGDVG